MKNLKRHLINSVILLIACVTPLLTGCDFDIFLTQKETKLSTPSITLYESSKCIVWSPITSAKGYIVYCNDVIEIEIEQNLDTYVYDFSTLLTQVGTYNFYIIAYSNSQLIENSDKSNTVTYSNTIQTNPNINSGYQIGEAEIELSLNNKTVNYQLSDEVEGKDLKMYLYSNSTGLNDYDIESESINLASTQYSLQDEIYAIRLGYVDNDIEKIASDIIFYNPDKQSQYSQKIYLFDGYINDFYIESLQELNNVIYHTFIDRRQDFDIKLSSSFMSVLSSFAGSSNVAKLNKAISYSFSQFYETWSYTPGNSGGFSKLVNNQTNEYNIKITYGAYECDTTILPNQDELLRQSVSDPYYSQVTYTPRDNNHNNFASDNQFLYTTVSTSEELYWAIENKVTPVFENTNNRAYQIYSTAKSVLNSIVYDEMSDFEKALSIFDWISINTVYDYTSYNASIYPQEVVNNPMKLPCFYLEGVFLTGYAVCDGFSKAYSLLCNMEGIDAIRIVGTAYTRTGSGGHAWNKVFIDPDPTDEIEPNSYLVDITWTEIASADGDEVSSHYYFLISDENTVDTHKQWTAREKFQKWASPENFHYFSYVSFEYDAVDYDLVMRNETELNAMFMHLMNISGKSFEVVIDYDFMVDVYETVEGQTYNPDYDYAYVNTGEMILYYYLKDAFVETLRSNKFREQYLFMVQSSSLVEYAENKFGLLYVFTQNLLIDAQGEVEHLVQHLSQQNISGTYTFYILNSILDSASGSTPLAKVNNIFDQYLTFFSVDLTFDLLQTNASAAGEQATKFTMTVSQ